MFHENLFKIWCSRIVCGNKMQKEGLVCKAAFLDEKSVLVIIDSMNSRVNGIENLVSLTQSFL